MFRTLVNDPSIAPSSPRVVLADALLSTSPLQLSRWLEEVWSRGGIADDVGVWSRILTSAPAPNPLPLVDTNPLGDVVGRTRLPINLLATFRSGVAPNTATPIGPQPWSGDIGPLTGTAAPPIWRHLLYAYLVESTGIFEILAEVVRRYLVGETLPAPTTTTSVWVRSTEELFFRDPPLFSAGGLLTSQLRPNARVNRRNAYWRMFGVDLPHPHGSGVDGQPWKRDAGATSNTRFLEIWNELLRQVWLGFEHDTNSSGPKPTDGSYIAYLCRTLSEMLQLRRRGGMLAREEFAYVTMLSWFHLTVEHDTSLVLDLSANAGGAGNAADRLAAIGARVGVAPSRQARELFELADLVSPLMWAIEVGMFNTPSAADMLYRHANLGGISTEIARLMNRIIDLWQSATGERVKDLAVTTRPSSQVRSAQPTKMLPGGLVPTAQPSAVSTNGQPAGRR
ncbi:hypothetical protein [Nocardia sp. NPDC060259]|uniref:hypothetical protein n=1 Tax=Nocardia sp. NPDC060259 TaxID=3347088 RepID=UPI00365553A4